MNTFTVGGMIRFGWETFKKRPGFFIGVYFIIWIIGVLSSQLGSHVNSSETPTVLVIALAGAFVNIVISVLLKMGTFSLFLKAHDAPENTHIKDLWNPEMFWPYLGASVLVGLIVIAGFILLIVPGIIWALTYMFVPYLVIDRKLSPMAALRESARITKGHRWQLLGFLFALLGLNIVGLLCLVIGLLVTVPLSTLALVHAYRTLETAASEVAPASPVTAA